MSLVTPKHVESSQTRDQTHVPCIGRQILYHWTAREVPELTLKQVAYLGEEANASRVMRNGVGKRRIGEQRIALKKIRAEKAANSLL